MPLSIPTRKGVSQSLQTYVRSELPNLDPTPDRRSKIGAWVKSLASALFDWYLALKDYADHDPFPQTARGQFLLNGWWRALTHLDPIAAAPARGMITLTGPAGTTIPAGTRLSGNGTTYTIDTATSVVAQTVTVASLSYDTIRNLCIVETSGAHQLATGLTITVTGASLAPYNGAFQITVTSDSELTYVPTTAPATTPAVGTIGVASVWASATVTASSTGAATNISGGGTLTVTDSIPGIASTAITTFGGISGGSNIETTEAYRARILKALGTDFGAFTGDEIELVARSVAGVTSVFVNKATLNGTNGVYEGQVKIAFLRDNDATIFPSAQNVADVKSVIVANIMTAHTAPEDVIVVSPIPRTVNFHFVSITPDTVSMRAAIRFQLMQFFAEAVSYETVIAALDYQCAIKSTYDSARRQALTAFTLDMPIGDIVTLTNELPVLGTVTFG